MYVDVVVISIKLWNMYAAVVIYLYQCFMDSSLSPSGFPH